MSLSKGFLWNESGRNTIPWSNEKVVDICESERSI
jgi:hypothetical protein